MGKLYSTSYKTGGKGRPQYAEAPKRAVRTQLPDANPAKGESKQTLRGTPRKGNKSGLV